MKNSLFNPLTIAHFYAVTDAICKQTIDESKIEHSICMGGVTIHHGWRDGAPIVIMENHGQGLGDLSGVWYDDGQ